MEFRSKSADGDLDGDGLNDLLVGTITETGVRTDDRYGATYGLCGPVEDLASLDDACLKLESEAQDWAGASVDYLGDYDEDGYDDLVVGAPHLGTGPSAVYIVRGSRRGTISLEDADAVYKSPRAWDAAGYDVAGDFDFDGDGAGDLAVAAPGDILGEAPEPGRVLVFRGPFRGNLDEAEALMLVGSDVGDLAGFDIVPASDRNGDGRDELVISAPMDNQSAPWAGKVYVVQGFWPDNL